MTYARVFQSGNSQAVRLPKEFRFNAEQVEIFRQGNDIVLRERPASAAAIFDALAMSVVTLGELQHGAEKSQARDKALAVLQQLQAAIQVMPLAPTAGAHYGQIRAALERAGQPIGNNDLWIAAHARAEGWVLVTNNEREFCRVPGLAVESWVAAL